MCSNSGKSKDPVERDVDLCSGRCRNSIANTRIFRRYRPDELSPPRSPAPAPEDRLPRSGARHPACDPRCVPDHPPRRMADGAVLPSPRMRSIDVEVCRQGWEPGAPGLRIRTGLINPAEVPALNHGWPRQVRTCHQCAHPSAHGFCVARCGLSGGRSCVGRRRLRNAASKAGRSHRCGRSKYRRYRRGRAWPPPPACRCRRGRGRGGRRGR